MSRKKAHSERRGRLPPLTYDLWFVTNEIHSSPRPPEQPICHLIQADGCIAAVVFRTNLISHLDPSTDEAPVLAGLSDRCRRRGFFLLLLLLLTYIHYLHARIAAVFFLPGCSFDLAHHSLIPTRVKTRYPAVNNTAFPCQALSNLTPL